MCSQCGMAETTPPAYHPYAACLMMQAARNGRVVDANLRAVVEYGMKAQAAGVSLDTAMRDVRFASRRD